MSKSNRKQRVEDAETPEDILRMLLDTGPIDIDENGDGVSIDDLWPAWAERAREILGMPT